MITSHRSLHITTVQLAAVGIRGLFLSPRLKKKTVFSLSLSGGFFRRSFDFVLMEQSEFHGELLSVDSLLYQHQELHTHTHTIMTMMTFSLFKDFYFLVNNFFFLLIVSNSIVSFAI